jgi:hypothetical protein
MAATASMLIPARVVATLTDEHIRSVTARASGIVSRNFASAVVAPL